MAATPSGFLFAHFQGIPCNEGPILPIRTKCRTAMHLNNPSTPTSS